MLNLLITNIPFIMCVSLISLWIPSEAGMTAICNHSRVLTYEAFPILVVEIDPRLDPCEVWRRWKPGWRAEWQWLELLLQHPELQIGVWALKPSPWKLGRAVHTANAQSSGICWVVCVSGLHLSAHVEEWLGSMEMPIFFIQLHYKMERHQIYPSRLL